MHIKIRKQIPPKCAALVQGGPCMTMLSVMNSFSRGSGCTGGSRGICVMWQLVLLWLSLCLRMSQ